MLRYQQLRGGRFDTSGRREILGGVQKSAHGRGGDRTLGHLGVSASPTGSENGFAPPILSFGLHLWSPWQRIFFFLSSFLSFFLSFLTSFFLNFFLS